jgi:hypothetical protein
VGEGEWGHSCASHVMPWAKLGASTVCSDVVLPSGCQCGALTDMFSATASTKAYLTATLSKSAVLVCMIAYVTDVETHCHVIGSLAVAGQCIVCSPRFGGNNTCDDVDDEATASLSRSNIALNCHVLCVGRSSQHCWKFNPN